MAEFVIKLADERRVQEQVAAAATARAAARFVPRRLPRLLLQIAAVLAESRSQSNWSRSHFTISFSPIAPGYRFWLDQMLARTENAHLRAVDDVAGG